MTNARRQKHKGREEGKEVRTLSFLRSLSLSFRKEANLLSYFLSFMNFTVLHQLLSRRGWMGLSRWKGWCKTISNI